MSFALVVAGMLAVTFGSRFAGLALARIAAAVLAPLPPLRPDRRVRRPDHAVARRRRGEGEIRLAAAALAALAAWRTKQLWVAIAVGMAAFWLSAESVLDRSVNAGARRASVAARGRSRRDRRR